MVGAEYAADKLGRAVPDGRGATMKKRSWKRIFRPCGGTLCKEYGYHAHYFVEGY
jgi:hypothetical protein